MTEQEIKSLVQKQRRYFHTGVTLHTDYRLRALHRLRNYILTHETDIHAALKKDLGKSSTESYMCETGLVLGELQYMIRHLHTFSKEKTVWTPLAQFPSRSYKKPSPYGVVLILSPWNYPFLLTMDPLIDAIAAGNTVVVKPSAYSPHTSAFLQKLIQDCFDERHVSIVTGGRLENTCLLNQHFDYLFFTGSQSVGKEVMKKASEHLTPVTLELGGKSPCIVEKSADIRLAVRRIVFGKFLNCGQTCVAPDYIYCDRMVKEALIREICRQIRKQFKKVPLEQPDYGKIINEKHFGRLLALMEPDKIVHGGTSDPATLQIEPTVMDNVTFGDAVMQEEIFGPILPILTYDTLEEAIHNIRALPRPLALYLFTRQKAVVRKITSQCSFGGGCINDTVVHLATSEMGFGGCGESGMGSYHGKAGFDTFSHYKSIVHKGTWLDLPMRYQPYKAIHDRMIHFFLK